MPRTDKRSASLSGWLPVVVWLVIIGLASDGEMSAGRTAGWITYWLVILGIDANPEQVGWVNMIVRTCAHFVEYAVLAALMMRAQRITRPSRTVGSGIVIALLATVSCATLDELRQARLPTRTGSAADVLIDTAGAATAISLIWFLRRGAFCQPLGR
jgi:VanZ family protein